jgi:hypothetical protein
MKINENFERFRRGDPFYVPESPDHLETLVGWAFDRIRIIVSKENLHKKFHNVEQILDILHAAAKKKWVHLEFFWENGEWFLGVVWGFFWTNYVIKELAFKYWERCKFEKVLLTTRQDILNLPIVVKEFGRIYRREAKEYRRGKNIELTELFGDKYNGTQNT